MRNSSYRRRPSVGNMGWRRREIEENRSILGWVTGRRLAPLRSQWMGWGKGGNRSEEKAMDSVFISSYFTSMALLRITSLWLSNLYSINNYTDREEVQSRNLVNGNARGNSKSSMWGLKAKEAGAIEACVSGKPSGRGWRKGWLSSCHC